MTAKKYQFYIDTKKQEEFFEETVESAKYIDKHLYSNNKNLSLINDKDRYFLTSKEITVNSGNLIVKDFFEKNKIPIQDFYYVYRNYEKVKIYKWDIKTEKDLPHNVNIITKYGVCQEGIKTILNSKFNKSNTLYIAEINHPELLFVLSYLNDNIKTPFKNLLFLQNIKNTNEKEKSTKKIKYKLYLNDRLLVERFFPEELRTDKSLVEEVYLDIKEPKQLKLVTDNDLYIVKITYSDKVFYPNSTEFILEP